MKRAFHGLIIIASLAFMAYLLISQWNNIPETEITINLGLLVFSIFCLLILFLLDAYGWHLILLSLGQTINAQTSIRIWILSSVTRYLPGGIWPYIGRATMSKKVGIEYSVTSVSLYIETLLLASSSLAVGFPALLGTTGIPVSPYAVLASLVLFGLAIHPKVIMLLGFLPGNIGKIFSSLKLPLMRHIIILYVYYVVFWILFGAVFVCFVLSIYSVPSENWIHLGGAIALGFSIGFIVIIFPSGIGIREATIYLLLAPVLTPAASALISVGSRIWIISGEVLSLLLILIVKNRSSNNPSDKILS